MILLVLIIASQRQKMQESGGITVAAVVKQCGACGAQ